RRGTTLEAASPRGSLEARVAAQARDEEREHHLDDVVQRADEGDRGGSRLALAHLDLHLREPEPAAQGDERRLDFRVVVRIVAGEELDTRSIEREEPGGGVGDALSPEQRDNSREHADSDPSRERWSIRAARVDEART